MADGQKVAADVDWRCISLSDAGFRFQADCENEKVMAIYQVVGFRHFCIHGFSTTRDICTVIVWCLFASKSLTNTWKYHCYFAISTVISFKWSYLLKSSVSACLVISAIERLSVSVSLSFSSPPYLYQAQNRAAEFQFEYQYYHR